MSIVKKAILSAIGERFLESGEVIGVVNLSEKFCLIEFESEALVGVEWRHGDKVQINVGDWNMRTYTPLSFDAVNGRMKLLALVRHERTPGSRWVVEVKPKDTFRFRGPSRSLDMSAIIAPAVLFGDETSFGVAVALSEIAPQTGFVFEVATPIEEAKGVLAKFGIERPVVMARQASDMHMHETFVLLKKAADESNAKTLFLTGRAQAIQALRGFLKQDRALLAQTKSKAYWSPNKEGLD